MNNLESKPNPYSILLTLAIFAFLFSFTSCVQTCYNEPSNMGKPDFIRSVPIENAIYGPIRVKQKGDLYAIKADMKLRSNNDYCSVSIVLMSKTKDELYSYGQEFYYESGVETGYDEDGPWSESWEEKQTKAIADVIVREDIVYLKIEVKPSSQYLNEQIQLSLTPQSRPNSPKPHATASLIILVVLGGLSYLKTKRDSQ